MQIIIKQNWTCICMAFKESLEYMHTHERQLNVSNIKTITISPLNFQNNIAAAAAE